MRPRSSSTYRLLRVMILDFQPLFFRLWVSPFYESGAANVPKLLELCESLSASLDGIDAMVILEGLKYGSHSFTSYILLLIVL